MTTLTQMPLKRVQRKWLEKEYLSPIAPSVLPEADVKLIAEALMGAQRPLVITSYLGRNLRAPALLAELCDKLPISVVEMVGSDMCIRSDHEAYRGVTVTTHPEVLEADIILILDCDVPWIPTAGQPKKGRHSPTLPNLQTLADQVGTKIFHLDVDPLKQQMPRTSTHCLVLIMPADEGIQSSLSRRFADSKSVVGSLWNN